MFLYGEYEINIDGTSFYFETLEKAIEFAEDNKSEIIYGIGNDWNDYKKCWFCGEWYESSELNKESLCKSCEMALWSRGEY
jgi:hypothetical protein